MQGNKVKRIKYLGKQDTYNMEVKDHHNFSINGGLIVHNSGYGLVSYHHNLSHKVKTEPGSRLPWPLRTEEDKGPTKIAHDPYGSW